MSGPTLTQITGFLSLWLTGQEPPLAHRPISFTGAVGRFQVTAEARPNQVRVGELFAYRVVIEGEGELASLHAPRLENQRGFDSRFEPAGPTQWQPTETGAVFVYPLRARAEGTQRIPPLRFAFFDPMLRRYETALAPSVPLDVGPARVVDGDDLIVEPSPPGRNGPRAWPWLAGAGIALVSIAGLRVVWRRRGIMAALPALVPDETATQPPAACLSAHWPAENAERRIARIYDSLGAQLGLPVGRRESAALGEELMSRGVPHDLVERAVDQCQEADRLRYGPTAASEEAVADRLSEIHDALTEFLRRGV